MEKDIEYPAEITFKAVFKSNPDSILQIELIMKEFNLEASITSKQSKNEKFISYTITSVFPSDDNLNDVCSQITSLSDFRMIF